MIPEINLFLILFSMIENIACNYVVHALVVVIGTY